MAAPQPPQPTQQDPRVELATRLGSEIVQEIMQILPEVENALRPQPGGVESFVTRIDFVRDPSGAVRIHLGFERATPGNPFEMVAGWHPDGRMGPLPPEMAAQVLGQAPAPPLPQPAQQPIAYPVAAGQPMAAGPPLPPRDGYSEIPLTRVPGTPPLQRPFPGRRMPLADEGGIS